MPDDPDRLVKAIYAARRAMDTGFAPWEKLRPYARDHWRCVAETAREVIEEEMRAEAEVTR